MIKWCILISLLIHALIIFSTSDEQSEQKKTRLPKRVKVQIKKIKKKKEVAPKKKLSWEDLGTGRFKEEPKEEIKEEPTKSDDLAMATHQQAKEKHPEWFLCVHDAIKMVWGEEVIRRASFVSQKLPNTLRTRLGLHFGLTGHVIGVDMIKPSGFRFYDNWCVEAAKKARACPQPPNELRKNGKLVMAWDFILHVR